MKRSAKLMRPLWTVLLHMPTGNLAVGAGLAGLTACMGIALLGLSGWFITATALAGEHAASAIGFDVFMPSAGIRLLALGRTAARYGERLVTHDATFASLAALRQRIFSGMAHPQKLRNLILRPARLLFRLTVDIDALESFYLRILVPSAAALGGILLTCLLLYGLQRALGISLGLILICTMAGMVSILWISGWRPAVKRARATEILRAGAIDLIAGQIDLIMAGRLTAQRQVLDRADQRLAEADSAQNRLEMASRFVCRAIGVFAVAGALLAVGRLVAAHRMDAPGAALALLVILASIDPLIGLCRGALDTGRIRLAFRRLAPILSIQASTAPARRNDNAPGSVTLAHVTATYCQSTIPVLNDISLVMTPGERVALIGSSGAGKSTLLAFIAGEMSHCTLKTAPSETFSFSSPPVGVLTQRVELFQGSLRENLLLANPQADSTTLWQALEHADLADEVGNMPKGLDTRLGEGGSGLSVGQSRRFALARLLLQHRDVWLLDEPTEALDAATAKRVLHRLTLQAALSGKTILIATHLRREAELADRLLHMRAGRIVADVRRGTREFDMSLQALRPD